MLDVLADFSNKHMFYLSDFERAKYAEKAGIGITSQSIRGTAIQIQLCKSNGSPKVPEMPMLPILDPELALRRKGHNDLQNTHLCSGTECF